MYFDSVQAVIEMEGHGAFVWSAYAMTVLVLIIMVMIPLKRRRRLLRDIGGEMRREEGRAPAVGGAD